MTDDVLYPAVDKVNAETLVTSSSNGQTYNNNIRDKLNHVKVKRDKNIPTDHVVQDLVVKLKAMISLKSIKRYKKRQLLNRHDCWNKSCRQEKTFTFNNSLSIINHCPYKHPKRHGNNFYPSFCPRYRGRLFGSPCVLSCTQSVPDFGPDWMKNENVKYVHTGCLRCIFVTMSHKNETEMVLRTGKILKLSVDDVNKPRNMKQISQETFCWNCTYMACLNICGGVAITPSPDSTLTHFKTKDNILSQQYNSLYRDFKHASQVELREKMFFKDGIDPYNLHESIEERFREIIYPFTRSAYSVCTKLFDDFLELFEEMIKGLILLKNAGLTLEDICSIDKGSCSYYGLQTTPTMRNDPKLSSCQPYNITEFEKLLEQELISQFENRLRNEYQNMDENPEVLCGKESQPFDDDITINNPYLTFLTEINCHTLHSCNTVQFDKIFLTEKKMYLKNCIKLLRENQYFYVQSQSSSEHISSSKTESKFNPAETTDDIHNISVRIYNQTVCHVQSAIVAIFKSMKYGECENNIFLSTVGETNFRKSDINNCMDVGATFAIPSPNLDTYKREETLQQHPDLTLPDGKSRQFFKLKPNIPLTLSQITEDNVLPHNSALINNQPEMFRHNNEMILRPPYSLNKTLLKVKGRKKDAQFMCVINLMQPEVSHIEALQFLKNMKDIGAAFHYPYCSENSLLSKMEGPSFYFTVSCADCHQELAPPQKLEALFRSEPTNVKRSRLISCILRRNSTSFFTHLPVKCGCCGFLLCDYDGDRNGILHVPFHSPTKGYICSSRLRAHKCQDISIQSVYTGCITDSMHASAPMRYVQMYSVPRQLKSTKRKILFRSKSLPVIVFVSQPIEHTVENVTYVSQLVRKNNVLNFEDAVSNILHIWTYEMIKYENGPISPQTKTQIIHFRKNEAAIIQNKLKEKFRYRRNIPAKIHGVDELECSILKYEDNIGTRITFSSFSGKLIKRSLSCHAKLQYGTMSTFRSKTKEPISEISSFELALTELENDAKSFPPNNMVKSILQHTFHKFKDNNNVISPFNPQNTCNVGTTFVSKTVPIKNLTTPLSLISELKPKTVSIYPRRSSSFDTHSLNTDDFSKQMDAWKTELQELQKTVKNSSIKAGAIQHKIRTRPLSLHYETKQVIANTDRRRSVSFENGSTISNEFDNQMHLWQRELKNLQTNAQNPDFDKYFTTQYNIQEKQEQKKKSVHRRRSSVSFSSQAKDSDIRQSNLESEKCSLSKSGKFERIVRGRPRSLHSELSPDTTSTKTGRRRSCSFAPDSYTTEDLLKQVNEWKKELIALQKSIQTPPKHTRNSSIQFSDQNLTSHSAKEHDNAIKDKLLQLQENINDSFCEIAAANHRAITKTFSLHAGSKQERLDRRRHKSDSDYPVDKLSIKSKPKDELIQVKGSYGKTRVGIVKPSQPFTDTWPSTSKNPEVINEELSAELSAWEQELLELQKSVESPIIKHQKFYARNKRDISLDSRKSSSAVSSLQSEMVSELTELKTWNHTLRNLENSARSPHSRVQIRKKNIKSRTVSLHTEPNYIPLSNSRPKSESGLGISSELNQWKQKLRKLEEDAKTPHSITSTRDETPKTPLTMSSVNYGNVVGVEERHFNKKDVNKTIKDTWIDTPVSKNSENSIINIPRPSGHRLCPTPRHLPIVSAIESNRRRSNYDTTAKFIPLLSDQQATRLAVHTDNNTQVKLDCRKTADGVPEDLTKDKHPRRC